jgi:hypothetical protein
VEGTLSAVNWGNLSFPKDRGKPQSCLRKVVQEKEAESRFREEKQSNRRRKMKMQKTERPTRVLHRAHVQLGPVNSPMDVVLPV